MQRVYDTLGEYRQLIDKHDADTAKAVLTSAVRDAANGQEFADTVRDRYGLEPHVLTGDQEANLTFLGATSERDPEDDTTVLVIDIGGGSTEFVIGTAATQVAFTSPTRQASCARPNATCTAIPRPTTKSPTSPRTSARSSTQGVPPEHREAVSHAIAVAGTATSLASIAQQLVPYDPRRSRDTCSRTESEQPSRTASQQPRSSSASKHPASIPRVRRRSSPGR